MIVEVTIKVLRRFVSKSGRAFYQILVDDVSSPDILIVPDSVELEIGKVYKLRLRVSPRFGEIVK